MGNRRTVTPRADLGPKTESATSKRIRQGNTKTFGYKYRIRGPVSEVKVTHLPT